MRPLFIILLVVVILAVVKIFVLDKDKAENQANSAVSASQANIDRRIPVDIYVAKEESRSYLVFASGTLVPNEEVEIRSEVSGRIVSLNIDEGKYIRKGDLIAKLNDEDLVAQLKKLQYEEELADQIEARQNKLLDINAISKEEYDMAVNRVNILSSDKELLQILVEKTKVRAPFSGRMGLKNISVGAYVTPANIIATLVQTDPVKIDFSLPEKYANRVKVGQEITFLIDGEENAYKATIIAIDPKVDENLRTLRVRAKSSNNTGKLLPGMFVRVEVPLGDDDLIMIPSQAIVPILKGKKVYLMKQGKAVEVEITTGLRTDEKVHADSGIEVGDSLIISSLMSVEQGAAVKLRNVVP